jgi:hypothetical protein
VESPLSSYLVTSLDEEFQVKVVPHTITAEEIPRIIQRIGSILMSGVAAYYALLSRDPGHLAEAITKIYEDITAIKKMIED